jgi:hypothetical protein
LITLGFDDSMRAANDPEQRGIQEHAGQRGRQPDQQDARFDGLEQFARHLVEFDDADHLLPMGSKDGDVALDEAASAGTQMLMLGFGQMRGIDDSAMDDEVGAQRFLKLVVAFEALADQRAVARPDHPPIGRIDVGAQDAGDARHVVEKALQLARRGAARTVEISIGVLGGDDTANEAGRYLGLLADHAFGQKGRERPRRQGADDRHRSQRSQGKPANQIKRPELLGGTCNAHGNSPGMGRTASLSLPRSLRI